mmetsp:Transcript_11233/g.26470  ORF Transcript_11233/g.26470 Transcript_11233/m.26470 type:complete len:479 (+) Transcript_11233:201-1637(+)
MMTWNTNCRSRQHRIHLFLLKSFLRVWSILFVTLPLFHSNHCHNCQRDNFSPYFCEASTIAAQPTRQRPENRRQGLLEKMTQTISAVAGEAIRFKSIQTIDSEFDDQDDIGLSGYQSDFNDDNGQRQQQLQYGCGESFVFSRFQSPACIRRAFDAVRSQKSFQWYEGKDGRKGYVSSTKLGGNYVLAESKQVAVDCSTEDVLRAYLSGKLQAKWSAKNLMATYFTKCKKIKGCDNFEDADDDIYELDTSERKPTRRKFWARMRSSFDGGSSRNTFAEGEKTINHNNGPKIRPDNSNGSNSTDSKDENKAIDNKDDACDRYVYRQDLLLNSQRVLLSHTGTMRYQQIIEVDKIGKDSYTALVRLLKPKKTYPQNGDDETPTKKFTTTAKKPFESLQVYVGLEQAGDDVKIYAAGVFEVNRQVVPKIIVFDTSGFAGSLAGKGTLWLSAYFEQRSAQRKQMQARKKLQQTSSSSSSNNID